MAISHRAGEFFAFSEGEYSDYSFNGLYRALVDIDLAQAARDFLPYLRAEALVKGEAFPDTDDEEDPTIRYHYSVNTSGFGSYLIRRGLAEPIDYDEIHAGSYGELITMGVIAHAETRALQLVKRDAEVARLKRDQV